MQIQVPFPYVDEFANGSSGTPVPLSSARRVAPSVSGGSRRMSLSAPVRVLQRKVKDEEGEGDREGQGYRRRYVLLTFSSSDILFFCTFLSAFHSCLLLILVCSPEV